MSLRTRPRTRRAEGSAAFSREVFFNAARQRGSAALHDQLLWVQGDYARKSQVRHKNLIGLIGACVGLGLAVTGLWSLPEVLAQRDLRPLGSRIRARLSLQALSHQDIAALLDRCLIAGGSHLLTDGLRQTLVEHALGNPRILCIMANDLLYTAAALDLKQLDEQLYPDLFAGAPIEPRRPRKPATGARQVA